jgi:hypothetical protein
MEELDCQLVEVISKKAHSNINGTLYFWCIVSANDKKYKAMIYATTLWHNNISEGTWLKAKTSGSLMIVHYEKGWYTLSVLM